MAEILNNAPIQLTTTNPTPVYTPTNSTGEEVTTIGSILVTRTVIDGTTPTLTLNLNDANNNRLARIATAIEIPDGYPQEILSRPMVIKAGQQISATASVANYLDIIVSMAEVK